MDALKVCGILMDWLGGWNSIHGVRPVTHSILGVGWHDTNWGLVVGCDWVVHLAQESAGLYVDAHLERCLCFHIAAGTICSILAAMKRSDRR